MSDEPVGERCLMCGAPSDIEATSCAACGESLIPILESAHDNVPAVPLFDGRQVGVIAFLFGLPAGLTLLTANGLRLRDIQRVCLGWLIGGPFWLMTIFASDAVPADPLLLTLLLAGISTLFAGALYRRWYQQPVQARMEAGLRSASFLLAFLYGGLTLIIVMVCFFALMFAAGEVVTL